MTLLLQSHPLDPDSPRISLGSLSPVPQLSLWIALAVGIALASLASWLSQPFPSCQCTHCDSFCSYARYASAHTATFLLLLRPLCQCPHCDLPCPVLLFLPYVHARISLPQPFPVPALSVLCSLPSHQHHHLLASRARARHVQKRPF